MSATTGEGEKAASTYGILHVTARTIVDKGSDRRAEVSGHGLTRVYHDPA